MAHRLDAGLLSRAGHSLPGGFIATSSKWKMFQVWRVSGQILHIRCSPSLREEMQFKVVVLTQKAPGPAISLSSGLRMNPPPPPCPGGNTGSRKKAPARSLARLLITCASPPLPAPLASRAHWPATLQGKVSLKIHRYIPLHANQLQKTTRALNIF